MNIVVTGGTGFVGRAYCEQLLSKGIDLYVLTRQGSAANHLFSQPVVCVVSLSDIPADIPIDAVINLSGESIGEGRWSNNRKQALYASRIGITKQLIAWMDNREQKPRVLLSASAVGFYGDAGNAHDILSEETVPGLGFTHEICDAWEKAAFEAKKLGVRVCCFRIGVVLGRNGSKPGGVLKKLTPVFKAGLGGKLGNGQQAFPWIHLDDLIRLFEFTRQHEDIEGIVNAVSSERVSQLVFAKTLSKTLKRPAFFPTPAFVLKVLLGEQAQLLLDDLPVEPKRAKELGFDWRFPTLALALQQVYGS